MTTDNICHQNTLVNERRNSYMGDIKTCYMSQKQIQMVTNNIKEKNMI